MTIYVPMWPKHVPMLPNHVPMWPIYVPMWPKHVPHVAKTCSHAAKTISINIVMKTIVWPDVYSIEIDDANLAVNLYNLSEFHLVLAIPTSKTNTCFQISIRQITYVALVENIVDNIK